MKVVHLGMGVVPVPPGDEAVGVEMHICELTKHLAQLGCQVHVIDIKGGTQQREKRRESLAKFYEVWHPPLPHRYNSPFLQHFRNYLLIMSQSVLFALLSLLPLFALLGKEKIEVIHTHNRDAAIAAILVNKLRQKPAVVIYCPQGAFGLKKLAWRKKLINFVEMPALKWVDHVVALTPAVKRWLVSEFHLAQAKITPIHSGVALDEVRLFLSQKTGVCHQSNIVLCTGVISSRKNQLTAVKVIPQVVATHPEVKFVFAGPVGEAKYFDSIQRFITENDLFRWVEFKGLVTKQELYNLYSDAILFLFPSTAEVQPSTLIEALAFGLPVIASDIGPISDVVSEGKGSAILVDSYDVGGMATAIIRLLENVSLRQTMSQRAKELGQTFSYEHIAMQTLVLYNQLVQNKKK